MDDDSPQITRAEPQLLQQKTGTGKSPWTEIPDQHFSPLTAC
jgi:hypothetical protein